jgi:hypothetical protein
LDDDPRRHRTYLLDGDLEKALPLGNRQIPPLGDPTGEPEHWVPEVVDAVADECPVRVPVDVVTVDTAERRVQRVADAAQ